MNKRAIAILGAIFILIVGTLGFIIWQQSGGEEEVQNTPQIVEQPPVEVPVEQPEDIEPEQPVGQASRLSDDAVISPILTFRGDGISYAVSTGQLYMTDYAIANGTVLLSNKKEVVVPPKAGIAKILWPAVGNSYMAELGSGLAKTWSFYNPNTGSYVDLPTQVKSLDWMPSGDKIMFVWVDQNNQAFLNLADPDTNNYQVLTDLYEPDNVIDIAPNGQTVLFYRTQTTDLTKNTINSVTSDGKTFKTVISDGYNTGVTWSPDSTKFLFTKIDSASRRPMLWYHNLSTGETKNLGMATINTKAVWTKDSQSVVIAVPKTGTAGQGITQDTVYKVTLATDIRQTYDPGIAVDVQDLLLSQDETVLFFRNASDNSLYYIPL